MANVSGVSLQVLMILSGLFVYLGLAGCWLCGVLDDLT